MKKIVLVGLYFEQNLGDPMLFDCAKYLLMQHGDYDIQYFDIFGRSACNTEGSLSTLKQFVTKGLEFFRMTELIRKLMNRKFNAEDFSRRAEEAFNNAEMIVIVGGGITKYSVRYDFSFVFEQLAGIAEKLNIPVIIGPTGIEGRFEKSDSGFQRMMRGYCGKTVKMAATRDRIDVLNSLLEKSPVEGKLLADFGVWSGETYQINKDENSKIVGFGLITPYRFREYGVDLSETELISLWIKIVAELEQRGYKWRLFSNGQYTDQEFGERLLKKMGLPVNEEYIVSRPRHPRELVQTVSQFMGIITHRLHSTIIAYSLGIPFIALSWNPKVNYFAERIDCEKWVFGSENFDARVIVDQFEKAIKNGYDPAIRMRFKEETDCFMNQVAKLLS